VPVSGIADIGDGHALVRISGLELLLDKTQQTGSNAEFLRQVQQAA
jgi:hypothetical protein